jgi:hypothetical protein
MSLTNLKTVTKTVTVASVTLTASADRIGLGFGMAQSYPADFLSPGHAPVPNNPEPEPLRSRQDDSAAPMRKQTRTDGTKVPDAVPPASLAGCLPPGLSADRVCWRVTATGTSRNCLTAASVARTRLGRDCQSPDRSVDKVRSPREVVSASAAGK